MSVAFPVIVIMSGFLFQLKQDTDIFFRSEGKKYSHISKLCELSVNFQNRVQSVKKCAMLDKVLGKVTGTFAFLWRDRT